MAQQQHPSDAGHATEHPIDNEIPPPNDSDDDDFVDESDTVENFCKLYPVFCTAEIPAKTISSLMSLTRASFPPSNGAVLCVLTSTDHDAHTHGTRVPAPAIHAPFRGKSVTDLASAFLNTFGDAWSQRAFGVLDDQSARDGSSILLVTVEDDEEESSNAPAQVLYYRSEFGCSLDLMIGYEEGGLGMENDARDLLGTDKVYTVERFEGMATGTWKATEEEGDHMGKSYMGPDGTGRVKGL